MLLSGELTMRARAKINLTLDVTGVRPDGYHTLDTIIHSVDFGDDVRVALDDAIRVRCDTETYMARGAGAASLSCDGFSAAPSSFGFVKTPSAADIPTDECNIAYRAVIVFVEAAKSRGGVPCAGASIHILKRIPVQAGLGGGSADAAAVLVALNRLTGAGFSADELREIGARVGADVPFCIEGGAARCTGIGEIVSSLPSLHTFVVLAKPAAGVSTPEAYRLLDTTTLPPHRPDTDAAEAALRRGDVRRLGAALANVFPVPSQTATLIERMCTHGAAGAGMTGSGSAAFALFETQTAATACAAALSAQGKAQGDIPDVTGGVPSGWPAHTAAFITVTTLSSFTPCNRADGLLK
ncbi:MAG: 4-(cytidine 5'-diphospho)-2-C-methyl-D-erythritol kinase [Oscillospiraceae bacterium]|nr:4-(cytidine 5'-diphospho)-2-C-methyl-D-erythritol kinase [Oscillospiraceae bacterium]